MAAIPPASLAAITAAATKYNISPQAMIAIAHHESNLNPTAVGDGGHAFGLFQLNNAGGTITGVANPQQYLNPVENANYAAQAISKLGISGESPTAQIAAIANRFERPADKGAEINDATNYYNSNLKGTATKTQAPAPTAQAPQATPQQATAPANPLDASRNSLLAYTMNQNTINSGQQGNAAAPSLQSLLTTALTATQTAKPAVATTLQTKTGKTIPVQMDPGVVPDHATAGAIKIAEKFLGTPYHFGGSNPNTGFDCSGLLQYAYKQMGINIPRVTYDQIKAGTAVNPKNIQPGDAVFFNGGEHVGMYIGNGQFIQAPHTGDVVKISNLSGYDGGTYAIRRYA